MKALLISISLILLTSCSLPQCVEEKKYCSYSTINLSYGTSVGMKGQINMMPIVNSNKIYIPCNQKEFYPDAKEEMKCEKYLFNK